jgi:DNA repair exonuclease SbcCD ATPase subunit
MLISIESVSIKNFLSFGNAHQEVAFKHGVNLVLGRDYDTGRSNGAGKSSFLEAIPFALFGETHKEIKKEQLLNWKNKKACEVILNFRVDGKGYRVERCIKPDSLSIFENDKLIERDAHVRDYQQVLESIVGMSFQTFCNLIHSNINSSNKILAMKKPEKRKFMEDVFGLHLYSELNTKANEKIRGLKEKTVEIDAAINAGLRSMVQIKEQIEEINSKIKNLGNSGVALQEAEADLLRITTDYQTKSGCKIVDIDAAIANHDGYIKANDLAEAEYRLRYGKIENKSLLVERWIREIETKLEEVKASEKYKHDYIAFAKKVGSPKEIIDKIEAIQIERIKAESDYASADSRLKALQIAMATIRANKKTEEERLLRLKDHNECPTCGQPINGSQSHIMKDIKDRLKQFTNELETAIIEENILSKSAIKFKDLVYKLGVDFRSLDKDKDYLYGLKDKIKVEYDEKKLGQDKQRYLKVNLTLAKAADQIDQKDIQRCIRNKNGKQERINELKAVKALIDTTMIKINALKSRIEMEERARFEFKAIIETNQQNCLNTEIEIKAQEKRKSTYANLIDYLEVIKEICKDENLKQYAISSIMPYLNRQTNHYLSEVGYGFFATIDKWLEADIKGPGIAKATYGSLSGGESKGIDLAIQFGLLDIAKIQAGRWPDILTMDEILDSSVDSKGIGKLMEIIRAKQIEDHNKIFIISHREELADDFEADNIYFVEKENGYSKISIR